MRILQINSVCDFGSTGRTTRELADYLEEKGHECYVAYGHGSTTYHRAFKVGSKWENHFHNAFFTRLLGLHGYGTRCGTKKLLRWINSIHPDIIHLRNLHANYLNFPMLFEYIVANDIPVVFTLHDCFNFTGKCSHYTASECYRWKASCGHCPVYRNTIAPSMIFDLSQRLLEEKKAFYAKMPRMTVVAVSQWLMHEAEQSILAGNGHKITFIYNWIDQKRFYSASDEQIEAFCDKYHLDRKQKYLISVSQGWNKDASRFKDAARLAEILPKDYQLVLVGSTAVGTSMPPSVIHIPYISDSNDLCAAYTLSEAYIHLSVEDTFGKVIAEAMCCGTVPITFDSTACGEVPGPYGIVVKPHDVDAIVKALPSLSEKKQKKDEMLKYVQDNYDYRTNAQKYIELYQELLK